MLSSIICLYHKWPKCAPAFFMLLLFPSDLSLGISSLHSESGETEHKIFVVVLLMLRGVREAICVLQASFLYISVQCLSFSQQPHVVDFMFSLNRLFPQHPFVKNCYLTSSSSSCIYVNDYSFLCFICTYWISYRFFQNFTHFYVIGFLLVHLMSISTSCLVHHSPS